MSIIEERLHKTRRLISENGFDALLVTKRENIFYLSGFDGSYASLLITQNNNFLFTDFRYIEQAKAVCACYNVIKTANGLIETLGKELDNLKSNLNIIAFEGSNMVYNSYRKLAEGLKDKNICFLPSEGVVEKLRSVKDSTEVESIMNASQIGLDVLENMKHMIKPGIKEKDIALELEYNLKKAGASKSAFDIIVASGNRSSLPHGVATEKELEDGDPVVIDWGCQVDGYHSDCTRTFFVGKTGEKWLEIYDIVKEAQDKAMRSLAPGMQGAEVDKIARDYIKDKGYGEYFGHGLGHGVGLEVHEKPTLSPRDKNILEEGMVVTIEPGIYLPGEGGVRLEELVLLKKNGLTVLTG